MFLVSTYLRDLRLVLQHRPRGLRQVVETGVALQDLGQGADGAELKEFVYVTVRLPINGLEGNNRSAIQWWWLAIR